jgi:hypothetical protein
MYAKGVLGFVCAKQADFDKQSGSMFAWILLFLKGIRSSRKRFCSLNIRFIEYTDSFQSAYGTVLNFQFIQKFLQESSYL